MNSTAGFIARKLCKSLKRLSLKGSNISGFEPGTHTRKRITICAVLQLTRKTQPIEIKLDRENLLKNRISIPEWVDSHVRTFAQYSYAQHCKDIIDRSIRSCFTKTPKEAPLDLLIGGKLIELFSYNLPKARIYQIKSTRDFLLFSTCFSGMNDEGDSTIRIPINQMDAVYTTNPKRPDLDKLLQIEVKKLFRQEGV